MKNKFGLIKCLMLNIKSAEVEKMDDYDELS